jgi:hypothetical protein
MSITRRTVLASGFTAIFIIFPIACHRAYPPALPSGVPISVQWAGGSDGGGWVTCSDDTTSERNICTIYDEEGRTRGPSQYKLRDLNRAAKESELHYTYVTGKAIGLDSGLELVQVSGKL